MYLWGANFGHHLVLLPITTRHLCSRPPPSPLPLCCLSQPSVTVHAVCAAAAAFGATCAAATAAACCFFCRCCRCCRFCRLCRCCHRRYRRHRRCRCRRCFRCRCLLPPAADAGCGYRNAATAVAVAFGDICCCCTSFAVAVAVAGFIGRCRWCCHLLLNGCALSLMFLAASRLARALGLL